MTVPAAVGNVSMSNLNGWRKALVEIQFSIVAFRSRCLPGLEPWTVATLPL